MKKGISINGIGMTYVGVRGNVTALRDVGLFIEPGEFVSFIGPSGCGKSTLMNIIAGFIEPTEGEIVIDDQKVTKPGPDRGVVFQQYAVFPWLTVRKNVEFGLNLGANAGLASAREAIVDHFLGLVGLHEFADSYPKELSGGMKQRVAIARAYAVNPEVLLMDEPFGALDAQTRQFMQEALLQILERERKTVVFITHSVEEAVFLSTRIAVMTARPGTVKEVVDVRLPGRRDSNTKCSPEFVAMQARIQEVVSMEFQKQLVFGATNGP